MAWIIEVHGVPAGCVHSLEVSPSIYQSIQEMI